MRRNLLITICILILSSVCLFAESSLGSIRFDYNIYKESVGTVSSVYFVDADGNRVSEAAIDMTKTANDFQLYFVQENNLRATDTVRRVKLLFNVFKPSDGKNAGFNTGKYTVILWRLKDPTNRTSAILKRDKDKKVAGYNYPLEWGLDNSNSQNGEPIACYYPLSFEFSLDDYYPGEYSSTVTVELQGN